MAPESTHTHTHTHMHTHVRAHTHMHSHTRACVLPHQPVHTLTHSTAYTHTCATAHEYTLLRMHTHPHSLVSPPSHPLLSVLSCLAVLLCSRLQPGGTCGDGPVPLSSCPQSLGGEGCLAPAPQDEYCIEHVGGPGRASLFAFPQCFLISPVFCHTSPPTFFWSTVVWSHMM